MCTKPCIHMSMLISVSIIYIHIIIHGPTHISKFNPMPHPSFVHCFFSKFFFSLKLGNFAYIIILHLIICSKIIYMYSNFRIAQSFLSFFSKAQYLSVIFVFHLIAFGQNSLSLSKVLFLTYYTVVKSHIRRRRRG